MKIRLNTRPAALLGGMLVIAMIALMPMRLALGLFGLGQYGLSARDVSGSIWFGRLNQAHIGDIDLGDLRAGLSPWQLLIGRARVQLAGVDQGDRPALHGAIEVSRHSFGIAGMTASVPVGGVFSPVPVSSVSLDDVTVRFENGGCARAEGQVKAMIGGSIADIALPPTMSGPARCEGAALFVPLKSQAGTETVNLRITADGRYIAQLVLQPGDPIVAQKLAAAGFQPGPQGYSFSVDGHF